MLTGLVIETSIKTYVKSSPIQATDIALNPNDMNANSMLKPLSNKHIIKIAPIPASNTAKKADGLAVLNVDTSPHALEVPSEAKVDDAGELTGEANVEALIAELQVQKQATGRQKW